MPKRSNQFQRLAAAVHTRMSPQGWTVAESRFFADKITGEPREVDVAASGVVAGHEIHLCIECRDHERPATVAWVEEMAQKHASLPTSKLVLWSRKGFTKSAVRKAKHMDIDLVSAGAVPAIDWAKMARSMIGSHLELVTPSLSAFIDLQHADGRFTRIEEAWDTAMFDAAGAPLGAPRDFRPLLLTNELLRTTMLDHAPVGAGDFWMHIVPPDGVVWYVRGETGELIGVHRLGVGMATQREHLPVEVASVPREDKVVTLVSAKKRDGSMVDLYIEETEAGSPQVRATSTHSEAKKQLPDRRRVAAVRRSR